MRTTPPGSTPEKQGTGRGRAGDFILLALLLSSAAVHYTAVREVYLDAFRAMALAVRTALFP